MLNFKWKFYSSILYKYLYFEPTVLQARLYVSKMQHKFTIVSKAVYGFYLKLRMV